MYFFSFPFDSLKVTFTSFACHHFQFQTLYHLSLENTRKTSTHAIYLKLFTVLFFSSTLLFFCQLFFFLFHNYMLAKGYILGFHFDLWVNTRVFDFQRKGKLQWATGECSWGCKPVIYLLLFLTTFLLFSGVEERNVYRLFRKIKIGLTLTSKTTTPFWLAI